jgi:hypothetical protein
MSPANSSLERSGRDHTDARGGAPAPLLALSLRLAPLGIAMRATSDNPNAARLLGIQVNRVAAFPWMLGALATAITRLALAGGAYVTGGMAPTLNYAASDGSPAASPGAMYITCTSSHRWQPTVPDLVCA